jgi:hypothetical protein
MRRDRPCSSQNVFICRLWRKLCYFVPDWDISTCQRSFYSVYTKNLVHTALCVGTGPAASKTPSFVVFDEHSVISSLIEIFRRFNTHFTTLYTKNVVHTALCVGTGRAASKTQSFIVFDENSVIRSWLRHFDVSTLILLRLHWERSAHCFTRRKRPCSSQMHSFVDFDETSVISFLTEIFRRFNTHFTTFYTENVVHTALFIGTGPAAHKTHSFVDFDQNSVISFLTEIFRRFNAHFTPFYTQNLVQTALRVGKGPAARKCIHLSILTKPLLFRSWLRCFDVSTLILLRLHGKRSAHYFMRRNRPCS